MELREFLTAGITPWHVQALIVGELGRAGFTELAERGEWRIRRGGAYYVRRGAAVAAFRVGTADSFALSACHTDSPGFRLKQAPDRAVGGDWVALTEPYGGAIHYTWTDRPLGVAGVVWTARGDDAERRLVDLDADFMIPSVAVHYRRDVNKGVAFDPAVDLNLVSDGPLAPRVAAAAGVKAREVLSAELYVYSRERPFAVGDGLLCAPRADDLVSARAMLDALIAAEAPAAIPVAFFATHEEVGSAFRSGAGGTMLADVLAGIAGALGIETRRMLADSLLLSADGAHAAHPLHPELSKDTDACKLGGGVALKFHAGQRYTTDAESAAAVRVLAARAGVGIQNFAVRSDLPCGSTLGVISNAQVSVRAADVGVAQLAMHASSETFALADFDALTRLLGEFDRTALRFDGGVRCL